MKSQKSKSTKKSSSLSSKSKSRVKAKGQTFLKSHSDTSENLETRVNGNFISQKALDFDQLVDEVTQKISDAEKSLEVSASSLTQQTDLTDMDEEVSPPEFNYNSCQTNSYDSIATIFNNNEVEITKFDDTMMIMDLQNEFPDLKLSVPDATMRNTIIQIISNQAFMLKYLSKYDINIFYFFKLIYRFYSHLFNAAFVKKIQKTLKYKKYVPKKQAFKKKKSSWRKKSLKKQKKTKKYDF